MHEPGVRHVETSDRPFGFLRRVCAMLTSSVLRAAQGENLQLSTAQWREDLQFIARELPKRHSNAFISRLGNVLKLLWPSSIASYPSSTRGTSMSA